VTKTQQVANAMRQLIAEGFWKPEESVGDLGKLEIRSEELFGVHASFGTIRAAEQLLVNEGILSPIQPGLPTRVRSVPVRRNEKVTAAELRAVYVRLGEAYAMLGELVAGSAE
jgi:hypothetical protein